MRNVIFYIVKFYFLIKNIKIYNYNLFFYNNKKQPHPYNHHINNKLQRLFSVKFILNPL